jgi:hypothetical protein
MKNVRYAYISEVVCVEISEPNLARNRIFLGLSATKKCRKPPGGGGGGDTDVFLFNSHKYFRND